MDFFGKYKFSGLENLRGDLKEKMNAVIRRYGAGSGGEGSLDLDVKRSVALHEGVEKMNGLLLAKGVESSVSVLNELELLCQGYMCIYHRVLKLKGVKFLASRNNFKEIWNMYLLLLENIDMRKYGSLRNMISFRSQIYATLIEDLIINFTSKFRYYLLWNSFNKVKNYNYLKFSKFKRMIEISSRFVRRQTKDEYWRLRKKLREMYPRESLLWILARHTQNKNYENIFYSFTKILDKSRIAQIKERDISRGIHIMKSLRLKRTSQILNFLILNFGKPSHLPYSSNKLLPLRSHNIYLKKLRNAFSIINTEKLWYYQDLILARKDEIRWYRREIKKRQYHRNITKMCSIFKSIRNCRLGDGLRKTFLNMKKPQYAERFGLLLNKLYVKTMINAFENIKIKGALKKKKLDEEAKMRIREGLISLDLFARNRLNEAFSTVRTVVLMYEVLNIQEVTDDTNLVSAYLNKSGADLSASGKILNLSHKGSIANVNSAQTLGLNNSNQDFMKPGLSMSHLLLNKSRNTLGVNYNNRTSVTSGINLGQRSHTKKNYNIQVKNNDQSPGFDRTPASSIADISMKNVSSKKKGGIRQKKDNYRTTSKKYIDNSRRFQRRGNFGVRGNQQHKDSFDFKFDDIRSLSPILKDNDNQGENRYFGNSRIDSNVKLMAADLSREMRNSTKNYNFEGGGGVVKVSANNPYIRGNGGRSMMQMGTKSSKKNNFFKSNVKKKGSGVGLNVSGMRKTSFKRKNEGWGYKSGNIEIKNQSKTITKSRTGMGNISYQKNSSRGMRAGGGGMKTSQNHFSGIGQSQANTNLSKKGGEYRYRKTSGGAARENRRSDIKAVFSKVSPSKKNFFSKTIISTKSPQTDIQMGGKSKRYKYSSKTKYKKIQNQGGLKQKKSSRTETSVLSSGQIDRIGGLVNQTQLSNYITSNQFSPGKINLSNLANGFDKRGRKEIRKDYVVYKQSEVRKEGLLENEGGFFDKGIERFESMKPEPEKWQEQRFGNRVGINNLFSQHGDGQ